MRTRLHKLPSRAAFLEECPCQTYEKVLHIMWPGAFQNNASVGCSVRNISTSQYRSSNRRLRPKVNGLGIFSSWNCAKSFTQYFWGWMFPMSPHYCLPLSQAWILTRRLMNAISLRAKFWKTISVEFLAEWTVSVTTLGPLTHTHTYIYIYKHMYIYIYNHMSI